MSLYCKHRNNHNHFFKTKAEHKQEVLNKTSLNENGIVTCK